MNGIFVGSNTNVQDNAVVHVSKYSLDGDSRATVIGDNVTIGTWITGQVTQVRRGAGCTQGGPNCSRSAGLITHLGHPVITLAFRSVLSVWMNPACLCLRYNRENLFHSWLKRYGRPLGMPKPMEPFQSACLSTRAGPV